MDGGAAPLASSGANCSQMSGEPGLEHDSAQVGFSGRRLGLSDLPLFRGVDKRLLDEVEAEFTWVALPGGATLFRQGDPADSLYLVVYGRLAAIIEDEAGTRVIAHIGAGGCKSL